MTRKRLLSMTAVALFVLALVAIGWALWPRRENVILITIDTMRPDRISAYGYEKHETPNIDRLAKEGTLFENAFCDVTWTTPSMTSVMTGLYASKHGLRSSFQTLSLDATTLAEILKEHGYQTAAIVASYPLHSIFGLNQGFDLYDEAFSTPMLVPQANGNANPDATPAAPPSPTTTPDDSKDPQVKAVMEFLLSKAVADAYRSDAEVSDRAIRWLREERTRKPFFLWVHYFGPHEKPTGIRDYLQERAVQLAAYDPDVVTVDAEIGRVLDVLDTLKLTQNTTVILDADHGQSLTDHDYFGHGRNVLDPTQRIPLMIRSPRHVPSKHRVRNLARNLDVMPTVLDLLDIQIPLGLDGETLVPRIKGKALSNDDAIYVETYLPATWLFADVVDQRLDARIGYRRLGYRTLQWKYVINDPVPMIDRASEVTEEEHRKYYYEELYDLQSDPTETTNVVHDHPDVAKTFWKEIGDAQKPADLAQPIVLDDPTRDRLKALGYLSE